MLVSALWPWLHDYKKILCHASMAYPGPVNALLPAMLAYVLRSTNNNQWLSRKKPNFADQSNLVICNIDKR